MSIGGCQCPVVNTMFVFDVRLRALLRCRHEQTTARRHARDPQHVRLHTARTLGSLRVRVPYKNSMSLRLASWPQCWQVRTGRT
jgi:hypothetical protein